MRRSLLLVVLILSLTKCGKEPSRGSNPTPPPVVPPTTKVTMSLFAAPWCTSCKTKLPELQSRIHALPKHVQESITTLFYVTEEAANVAPSQEVADAYRDFLHLDAIAVPDPWRWKTFRQHISPKILNVPAAAIFDDKNNKLKVYTAGDTVFVPSQIVDVLVSAVLEVN